MKAKKSQNALEFMIILIFMLVFVSAIMYIIGLYTVDLNVKKEKTKLDDFAASILEEVNTLQKVDGNYYREMIIPKSFMERYNVSINHSYLILENKFVTADDQKFYYYIPGEIPIKFYLNTTKNEGHIIFEKKYIEKYDGLNLFE